MPDNQIPPREQHPTIGKSTVVDTLANQFLPTLLPTEWRWRAQSPDYFVDYHVEVVEKGELTGFQFGLQIKGTATTKRRGQGIRYRMGRKALAYYRDNARVPVFVALVDTTKKTAHWIFAQRYLRERASKADLDNQNTLTLCFDAADSFADLDRFQTALKEAERYVRDLYPSRPAAAISERERELQALDPDVRVTVSFTEGREVLKLTPAKPLSLRLRSLNPDAPRAFQAMLEHGETFKAEVELTPPPSPLFQKLMQPRRGLIHFEPDPRDGCVQVVCGGIVPAIMQADGKWRGGSKSVRFSGSLARSPLSVELRIDRDERETSFRTPIDLSQWENQWLLRLPWFTEVRSFVSALATGEEFRANYFVEGMATGGFAARAKAMKEVQQLKETLDWLEKCRLVAKHYKIDPILPKFSDITYSQEREVEALWALATGNSSEDRITNQTVSFSGSSGFQPPEHWNSSRKPVVGAIKLIGTAAFDFLGHSIEVPNTEQILTNMKLLNLEVSETKKSVSFTGQENSIWIRQKVKSSGQESV